MINVNIVDENILIYMYMIQDRMLGSKSNTELTFRLNNFLWDYFVRSFP